MEKRVLQYDIFDMKAERGYLGQEKGVTHGRLKRQKNRKTN